METREAVDLEAKFIEMNRVIDRCVWDRGLSTYREHVDLEQKLSETVEAPREYLFAKATHYLRKVTISDKKNAGAISAFAMVISFAAKMSAAFEPRATADEPDGTTPSGAVIH